jgi:ATP-dependent DNA ligase
MTYAEISPYEANDVLESDRWVLQQKMDGTRVLMVHEAGAWRALTRRGEPLGHTAALQHLAGVIEELLPLASGEDVLALDGELIIESGEYRVFDIISWRPANLVGLVRASDAQYIRRRLLESLKLPGPKVSIVPEARTTSEKIALFQSVRAEGAEGVVAKQMTGPYEMGIRVEHVLKIKLVKSADVLVLARDTGGAKNAVLGVHAPNGAIVKIGACSMIGKEPAPVGAVIEINFLYWTGGAVYQPRMVRIREDKAEGECTVDQFGPYSRRTVEVSRG